jgi:pimeloyl-ACP methyl ester carboxylesterase
LRFACLAAFAVLTACASQPRPDFHQLYDFGPATADQPPVIVIPGVLGSRLCHSTTGEEFWPGSFWHLAFTPKSDLALKIDPQTLEPIADDTEACGLFEGALGQDFYGEILQTLEQWGGYRRTNPGEPVRDKMRRYYVFAYDWRQDNVVTARKLDTLIEQIRRDHHDPKLRVDIIAHSMGGLVTRYFLRYGTADVLDSNELEINFAGARKVRHVILLGTPNLGSIRSLHSFLAGADVGFKRIPTEVLATMPSLYELFPHPLSSWLAGVDGKTLHLDLFAAEVWQGYGWSVFNRDIGERLRKDMGDAYLDVLQRHFTKRLERARRFTWALTRGDVKDSPERLIVFGGDCTPTPARLLVEPDEDYSVVRLFPSEISHPQKGVDYVRLMLEPGDGQVTKPSLLARDNLNPAVPRQDWAFFPLAYSFLLCEEHSHLTGNPSFQNNLLNVLLTVERPLEGSGAGEAPATEETPMRPARPARAKTPKTRSSRP